jgi:hypothetical protein
MQRQLRQTLERLREQDLVTPFLWVPTSVDFEVQSTLNSYLAAARVKHYAEFNGKVLEEAASLMEVDGCFAMLRWRGDPLDSSDAA